MITNKTEMLAFLATKDAPDSMVRRFTKIPDRHLTKWLAAFDNEEEQIRVKLGLQE